MIELGLASRTSTINNARCGEAESCSRAGAARGETVVSGVLPIFARIASARITARWRSGVVADYVRAGCARKADRNDDGPRLYTALMAPSLGTNAPHGSANSPRRRRVRGRAAVRPMYLGAADADRGIGSRDQERARKAACTNSARALKLAVTAGSRTADLRRADRPSAARAGECRRGWFASCDRAPGHPRNDQERGRQSAPVRRQQRAAGFIWCQTAARCSVPVDCVA